MRPLLLVLAALSPALPAAALACSCMAPGETFFLQPADGSTGVPTNARIWVGGATTRGNFEDDPQLPIELFDATGAPVEGTEGRLRSSFEVIDVFTPLEALEPGTRYSVVVGEVEQMSFITGAESDVEAPALPSETERSGWSRPAGPANFDSCSNGQGSHGISFSFDLGEGVLVLLDSDERADLDDVAIAGEVPALSPFGSVSLGRGFGCGGDNWEDAKFKAQTEVRWSTFDLAGNWSGWSEPEFAVVSRDGRGGCNAGGSVPGASAWAAAGLVGVALAGRSRRP